MLNIYINVTTEYHDRVWDTFPFDGARFSSLGSGRLSGFSKVLLNPRRIFQLGLWLEVGCCRLG